MSDRPALPIEGIEPGTTLLVGSDDLERAQQFALWLVLQGSGSDDGILLASRDVPVDEVLSTFGRFDADFDALQVQVIDCTGERETGGPTDAVPDDEFELPADVAAELDENGQDDGTAEFDADVEYLPSADLTELGVKFSVMHQNLTGGGCRRILTGVNTISSIVDETDLRTAVRFMRSISSRIEDEGGLAVFVVDLDAHDERTVATLSQVADGLITVRGADGDDEIRIEGLADQPDGWLPVPIPE